MRKFYITEAQLKEIIDSDIIIGNDSTPEYQASTISTTEPVGDDNYGDPMTGDDKQRSMPPGTFQRMTSRGNYGGPSI